MLNLKNVETILIPYDMLRHCVIISLLVFMWIVAAISSKFKVPFVIISLLVFMWIVAAISSKFKVLFVIRSEKYHYANDIEKTVVTNHL